MSDPSTQELFRIESKAVPPGARVAGFRGREALSELYHFSIGVLTHGEEIDLSEARGLAATLITQAGGDRTLPMHGMIARAALRHAWAGQALYELVVVPKVWALTLSHYSRVFVDKSVVDILEEILDDSGISTEDYELRLQAQHPARHHTCQYKESRWSFLSRLMERDGLYYFFEQGDAHEKLIITDHRSCHRPLLDAPVRYVPLSGGDDAISSEALVMVTSEAIYVPRSVQLRDFDYLRPTLDVKAEAEAWAESAAAQVHHGEHDFRSAEAGEPLARVEAEAWQTREQQLSGRGRVFGLRPGYRFRVDEHPLDSLNRDYLATEVRHVASQAAGSPIVRDLLGLDTTEDYRVEVAAISAETQFRPSRKTTIPRINSVERARVDGPADSEYAQIDEHGRYKVKLHFDIDDSDKWEGEASTWVRMLQPHGGTTEGFHFPLRKNTEVLIVFLGGDPDRPVIAGAVPNAVQPSPVTTDNHSQNVIMTGGSNRFEIEDREGKQYIDISTPPMDTRIHLGEPHGDHSHYIVEHTDGDQLIDIGGTRDIEVGGEQNEHVVGVVDEDYDSDHSQWVGGSQEIEVMGSRSVDVTGPQSHLIGGLVEETYKASQKTTVTGVRVEEVSGAVSETYKSSQVTDVSSAAQLFGGTIYQFSKGTYDISANGAVTVRSGGAMTLDSLGPYKLSAPTADWLSGPAFKLAVGAETSITAAAKTSITASIELSVSAGAKIQASGGYTLTLAAGLQKQSSALRLIDAGPKDEKVPSYTLSTGPFTITCTSLVVI